MKRIRFDSISIDETYYTDEGYLVDHPIVTTCGVFEYKNNDGSIRRELRKPEDVFSEESLKSYKGKPIIITHDAGEVSKDNVRREQIGTIMSDGYRDGDSVRCEIIIHDTNALKRCGLRELSLGYALKTVEEPGVYNGEDYDCIQKNIEINHLALVGEARAGETARLNIDGKEDDIQILKGGKATMVKSNKYTDSSRADGTSDLTPEELEAAVALFLAQKAANQATEEEMDGAKEEPVPETGTEPEPVAEPEEGNTIDRVRANIDRRDSEGGDLTPEEIIKEQKEDLDLLLAEVDRLQAASDMASDEAEAEADGDDTGNQDAESEETEKGLNMDSVDRIVRERLDICRMADKLNLDGVDALSVKDGKIRIIKAVNPKMNLDGKSASYIDAAYDIAKQGFSERKSTDDQRKQMIGKAGTRNDGVKNSGSDTARKNMINRMTGGKN